MRKFLLIFIFAFLNSFSDCFLKIEKNDCEKLLIKNRYIEVEIMPKFGGVISRFEINKIPVIFPFRIIKEEFYPGSPLYSEIPNYAGVSDWIWPGSGNLKKENYDYEILENNKEKVSVNLKVKGKIERKISVYKDKSILEIDVKGDFDKKSYWFHPLFSPGGDFDENDFLFIPVAKTDKRVRNITEITDKEEIKSFHPKESNYFYLPAQNWFCLIDRNKRILGGVVIEKKFIGKNAVFYSWNGNVEGGKRGISLEVIFPENENEFKIYVVSLLGLDKISYLSENIGLSFESEERVLKNRDIPFSVKISSPFHKDFILRIEIGENHKDIFLRGLSPFKSFNYKGKIRGIDRTGKYKWRFKIIKEGKIIEDFEILKEMEVI